MGEPDAVLLLSCCTDTMSSRLQSRSRSSSVPPAADREGALHRRVESSCSDSQAVADHYESKKLLHTVTAFREGCVFIQCGWRQLTLRVGALIPSQGSSSSHITFKGPPNPYSRKFI